MEIKIGLPLSFSEIGQKDNQEDYVFPSPEDAGREDRVFILCDGMGGHSHGEVASRTVATTLGRFMKEHFTSGGRMTKELFNEGLKYAYGALNLVDDGAAKKMGTTLTFVCLHEGGCFCAHIGDSRIYIVRPSEGRIIFRSEDHSLVNDLVRAGELTPEEAVSYPRKNVITRAMQPNQERPARAEIHDIEDIQAGDYVFLCCDGILENLSDDKLVVILSGDGSDEEKINQIKRLCYGNTRDNFTCYLIPVTAVGEDVAPEEETFIPNAEIAQPVRQAPIRHRKWGLWLILLVLLSALAAVLYGQRGKLSGKKVNTEKVTVEENSE